MADEGTILITRSNRGMPQSRGAVCQRGARGFILFLVNFRVVLDASLFSSFFFFFFSFYGVYSRKDFINPPAWIKS